MHHNNYNKFVYSFAQIIQHTSFTEMKKRGNHPINPDIQSDAMKQREREGKGFFRQGKLH